MRTLTIVLAVLATPGFLLGLAPLAGDHHDFRRASWGMSMAEVKAGETGKQVFWCEAEDNLKFEGTVLGIPCYILYGFAHDKLVRVDVYFSRAAHEHEDEYLADYDALLAKLTEAHGEAEQENEVWQSKEYKDNPRKRGLAVSLGHLFKSATWKTPASEIKLSMGGNDRKISITIRYESVALKAGASDPTASAPKEP